MGGLVLKQTRQFLRLGYLMRVRECNLDVAYRSLKAMYPEANPQPSFMRQLRTFDAMGRDLRVSFAREWTESEVK